MLTATMNTKGGFKQITWQFWESQQLRASRECPLGLVTETETNSDERQIPRLSLAAASDGRTNVVIHPDRLKAFLLLHRHSFFVGHNVRSVFWVVDQHLSDRGDPDGRRVLWDACDAGRLFDTQILDMLLQLATGKFRHAAGVRNRETKIYPGDLAAVVEDYTILQISKNNPCRARLGELCGLREERWKGVDPGCFQQAVQNAVAIQRLYPTLASRAYELMIDLGLARQAQRYAIRPDALERFGYLSETLQVKASIALAYLFRRGVRTNLTKARALEAKYRGEMEQIITELERSYPEVLTRDSNGALKRTPKSQTPSLSPEKLKTVLVRVANEIRGQCPSFEVPTGRGQEQGISLSAKRWERYTSLHPFLSVWVRMKELEKLLGFLAGMTAEVLHGEYNLLMRTGRTSCTGPLSDQLPGLNIQQTPRTSEIRELFEANAGFKLFVGDFSTAELRTLAAVCKARFGSSRLGEVITAGRDPYAYTAAMIQGMSLERFEALKQSDPERYREERKRAKAILLGVMGGMGIESLRNHALLQYNVTLSLGEAEHFREKLINDVYPELNDADGYLTDNSMTVLARNLGVTETEAWETLAGSGQRNMLAARGVANVIRGVSTASDGYQQSVWSGLCCLLDKGGASSKEIAELVGREQGGQRLHSLLYRQSAATLTGRLRADVSYTESKNTPFQSLCADGAKLALWDLLYSGFNIYAFIHDEILIQLPAPVAETKAKEAERIMIRAMETVMGQGIPAACEAVVADCWAKPGQESRGNSSEAHLLIEPIEVK